MRLKAALEAQERMCLKRITESTEEHEHAIQQILYEVSTVIGIQEGLGVRVGLG